MIHKIKKWLKTIPIFVKLKRKIWSFFDGSSGLTTLNIINNFPLYTPRSAGKYKDRSLLTIQAINQSFPHLSSLAKYLKKKDVIIKNIETLSEDPINKFSIIALKEILDRYGSDKANRHKYHNIYGAILRDKNNIRNIFEIGLGTNYKNIVSNMGINGKPGASLRAFRDYCPNASVFGADIDKRILFEEERIKTFYVDQTDPVTFDPILEKIPKNFDLVIDDGLHSPNANIASLEFGLKIIKVGGWVVLEDISDKSISVWQTVSALLPNTFEPHIFSTDWTIIFAVKRLK